MTLDNIRRKFSVSVIAFLAVAAVAVFWLAIPVTSTNAEGGIMPREEIECRLGLKSCKAIRVEGRVTLPAIQFEYDSDRLTEGAVRQLIELAAALGAQSESPLSFAIQGHTDSTGSESYNRDLSLRRARAVKRYLSTKVPLSSERLVEVGLGESSLLPGMPGEDGRNRRVEIVKLDTNPSSRNGSGDWGATRKRALLVGVSAYHHVSSLLGAPVNDAKDMASFLSSHLGYREHDIKMLLDEEATRGNILAAITDWLIGGTRPGDEAFLYFSGHGFQEPDKNGDEADRRDETLVPVDTFVNANRELVGMLTDDEIGALLDGLTGREIHVVLDSCHSGTATKGGNIETEYVKSPRLPDGTLAQVAEVKGISGPGSSTQQESFLSSDAAGVTVWTASAADQRALVDRNKSARGRGSVFTRLFLRGVKDGEADRDKDGTVTVQELHQYLVAGSSLYCARHPADCSLGLTPQLFVDDASRLDEPAFGRLSRTAQLAKDLLVQGRTDTEVMGDVLVRIQSGPKIVVDDTIDIVVESNRDGHLVLLDVDGAGQLVQIFPNEYSINKGFSERILAGVPVTLPGAQGGFDFRAAGPSGRGMLIAVVSHGSALLQNLASRHKDLSVIARPEAYLVELAEVLRAPNSADTRRLASRKDWAVGKHEYQVISQRHHDQVRARKSQ